MLRTCTSIPHRGNRCHVKNWKFTLKLLQKMSLILSITAPKSSNSILTTHPSLKKTPRSEWCDTHSSVYTAGWLVKICGGLFLSKICQTKDLTQQLPFALHSNRHKRGNRVLVKYLGPFHLSIQGWSPKLKLECNIIILHWLHLQTCYPLQTQVG